MAVWRSAAGLRSQLSARIRPHGIQFAISKRSKVCFSGIQPTGTPHLGNYVGAIQRWKKMTQEGHDETIFSIVDYHALTTHKDATTLPSMIMDTARSLIACGLNEESSCILFQQSRVPEHAELAWILGCSTSLGSLKTMIQYKTKKEQNNNLGLFSYPVLQTADVLLYRTTHVPVGEDQRQHLELARGIATIFNQTYGDFFPKPELLIGSQESSKIMSLRDPLNKMSKSDRAKGSGIQLTDPPDVVMAKIKKAVTDSESNITYDPEGRPGVANLIRLYCALHEDTPSPSTVAQEFKEYNMLQLKEAVADVIIRHLAPIQEEIRALENDPGYVKQLLDSGASRAQDIATQTMDSVRRLTGLR
eukprot:m.57499 g.57499  ORF g.57499 m.57499 type:complete len:361 (+) comp11113_c0_seq1:57-1139(+)